MMAQQRCTCCHVCHTSEKTSRRRFLPCSTCQSIICEPCIELTNQQFHDLVGKRNWSCPRCEGNCPCKRCKNKRSTSPSDSSPKSRKRSQSPVFNDETFYTPAKVSRRVPTDTIAEVRNEVVKKISAPAPWEPHDRIAELKSKNRQCIEYILRTEKLLSLIRSEQDRIAVQINSLTSEPGSPYSSGSDLESESFLDTKLACY